MTENCQEPERGSVLSGGEGGRVHHDVAGAAERVLGPRPRPRHGRHRHPSGDHGRRSAGDPGRQADRHAGGGGDDRGRGSGVSLL